MPTKISLVVAFTVVLLALVTRCVAQGLYPTPTKENFKQFSGNKDLATDSQKKYFDAVNNYHSTQAQWNQHQPPATPFTQTGTHEQQICIFNGRCEPDRGENCQACPLDCFSHNDCCGDTICQNSIGEDATNCPQDCLCGNGFCDLRYGETCDTCLLDCKRDDAHVCCGNGVCDYGEDSRSCPEDCSCGDGLCQTEFENCHTCPDDCNVCQLTPIDWRED